MCLSLLIDFAALANLRLPKACNPPISCWQANLSLPQRSLRVKLIRNSADACKTTALTQCSTKLEIQTTKLSHKLISLPRRRLHKCFSFADNSMCSRSRLWKNFYCSGEPLAFSSPKVVPRPKLCRREAKQQTKMSVSLSCSKFSSFTKRKKNCVNKSL